MEHKFNVGDTVVICDKPQLDTHVHWDNWMGLYCGKVGVVCKVHDAETNHPIYTVVSDDGVEWGYDGKWLSFANKGCVK